MTIIKRADLGRPLTWDELDNNFRQVDDLTSAASAAVSSAAASATAAAGSAATSATSATDAANSAANAAAAIVSAVKSTITFTTGGTLNSNLDRISDGTYLYYWTGTYPVTIPPNSTLEGTGGVVSGAWAPDSGLPLQSALAVATKGYLGVIQGGYLENYLPQVSVDAFGADPTGETDSTAAVISAANAAKEMSDSAYAAGDDHFYRVVFGNGIYMLGDVPLYSFISYEGQGEGTLIKPLAGASFCFTTTGTTPATSTPLKRLFGASVKNMRIGAAYYDYTFPIVPRVGGINIKYASYITIDNVKMRRVDGPGLVLSEVWDSDFINMQLLYTGNIRDSENLMPALTINRGDSSDGSNGLRFWGLHIEQCAKPLQIETGVRQVFFMAPKIEAGSTSSTIVGTQGISFSHAHLTWARHDIPQFLISRTTAYESYGVHFESPQFNSGGTANRGWYIHHDSSSGQVSVTNPVAKSVKTMMSGINIVCKGGNAYGCGPDFIKGTGNCVVDGLVASTILGNSTDGVAPTDGTGDFIIVSGAGNVVRDCSLHAVGTSTDGLAFINIAGSIGDVVCRDNQFSGIRQIGVRGTQSSYKIRNNSVLIGAVVPTIMSGAAPRYVVLSAHASGTGPGGFKSASVSIAAGASGSLEIISGATDILIRGSASLGIPAAKLFADTNRTAMVLVAELGGVFVYGTGGVEGDGKIYISKSGSNLIITNYTTSAGTFYVTALSAVM